MERSTICCIVSRGRFRDFFGALDVSEAADDPERPEVDALEALVDDPGRDEPRDDASLGPSPSSARGERVVFVTGDVSISSGETTAGCEGGTVASSSSASRPRTLQIRQKYLPISPI